MTETKNILIVRTDRIGDVILTLPAVRALRKKYPQARLTMLVAPLTKDLLEGNDSLDEVMIDDRVRKHRGFFGFLKLIKRIRQKNFDTAIIFHTKKRTNSVCFLAGIPRRIGYKNNKFGFLLTDPIEDTRHEGKKHESEYCMEVLKTLDAESDDFSLSIPAHKDADHWVDQMLKTDGKGKVIAIHPGASDPSKCWPIERFRELMEQLTEKYHPQFIIIGTGDIREKAQQLANQTNAPTVMAAGVTDLSQLSCLLSRCDLLVSNDSGPVHMAAALGTPVVSIFTRNQPGINPERWRPLGSASRYVSAPFNDQISFAKAGSASAEYLELIPTQQVLEEVDALFKLC